MAEAADACIVALESSVAQALGGPGQNGVEVIEEHLREALQRRQPLPAEHLQPALEVAQRARPTAIRPEVLEGLLGDVGAAQASVQNQQPREPGAATPMKMALLGENQPLLPSQQRLALPRPCGRTPACGSRRRRRRGAARCGSDRRRWWPARRLGAWRGCNRRTCPSSPREAYGSGGGRACCRNARGSPDHVPSRPTRPRSLHGPTPP